MHSGSYADCIEFRGLLVEPSVAAVQRLMTEQGLTPEVQVEEWLRLARQRPEPQWMADCYEQSERMMALLQREAALRQSILARVNLPQSEAASPKPLPPLAERHFEWLGDRYGVPVDVLRAGIVALSRVGFISTDSEQQEAMRLALGFYVNREESSVQQPWVRWLPDADALNYLVQRLWKLELIHCPGGERNKWFTLRGAFLRADGGRFEPSIKNNRCTNPLKQREVDRALVSPLQHFVEAAR